MSNKIDSASKKDEMHIDYRTSGLRCRNNKESYGSICVKCGLCGREFDNDGVLKIKQLNK